MNFEDKVILITGASSGIGADAAQYFAKLGAKVAMCARREELLNEVADKIKADGSPTPLAIVADVNTDAERIINETVSHFGKIDVLVNNAGFGPITNIEDSDMDSFDGVVNTNLRSVVVLTKLAVPYLEETKGNIVNVSSIASMLVHKFAPFYCVAKAGLDQFTNCAAFELGPRGIRVNAINPGLVRTSFLAAAGLDEEAIEAVRSLSEQYPLRRSGEVEDTTKAIAFLASDSAAFITGVQLRVDGGAVTAAAC